MKIVLIIIGIITYLFLLGWLLVSMYDDAVKKPEEKNDT